MIGYQVGPEFLEVRPDTTLQVVINNPLFNEELETGMITYDHELAGSKVNKKLTGFPGQLNRPAGAPPAISANLWLDRQFFRRGRLNVLEVSGKNIRLNFQSDAGAIAGVKDDLLNELDLGYDQLGLAVKPLYPLANYALFPVSNPAFYGEENPDFKKYLNYYHNGFKTNALTNEHAMVPFPYLAYILRKVFAHYGFEITGTWIEAPETRCLVIYNTRALDLLSATGINQYKTLIDFWNHVPPVKVNEFLKDLRVLLGLSFIFKPNAGEVEIVRRKDVLQAEECDDWTELVVPAPGWAPNEENGFILEQKSDSGDAAQKEISDRLKYQVGKGKTTISTGCSYPDARVIKDEIHGFRSWLVPAAEQEGNSEAFDLGTGNGFSFRLLSYYGLQPDSEGSLYPMASFGAENITGLNIGQQSLAWEGDKGLYHQAHKPWLDFKSETERIPVPVRLSVSQLSLLNPCRKVLIRTLQGTFKALWQKIEFDVNNQQGIKTAKVTFYKVRN